MKIFAVVAIALTLVACSTPVTQVKSVDLRPTLSITNAPSGSVLIINGVTVGDAGQIAAGKQAVVMNPGTHHVVVALNGQMLINEKIYFGEGLNKTLSAGAKP
ncbi:MAG: PEGA domain-containing protein [Moraxellaceae bacterium]|nr:PEGA domain-containing protein [Moraxellaceae bacterium]MDZ4386315.1 PEGA domain-containing protein [Moraxellaceae bacterium]